MIFRNITLFSFPANLKFDDFDTALLAVALKPVGPQDIASQGFVPPFGVAGDEADGLSHRIDDAIWITAGSEERLLPSAVVNDQLQKKLAEFEAAQGRRPGGKVRTQMKEDLINELLPRAFVRPSRVDALIDLRLHVIAIDTTSRKVAENVVSLVRKALGSFPALPVAGESAPRGVLTAWIAGEPMPEGLGLGDEAELRDPADQGAIVKVQRMELEGEEIETHLATGKQATRLALTLDDHMRFVLGDDLVVRKFKLLEGAVSALESSDRDDIRAEMDARFALMSGEFRRFYQVMQKAFGLHSDDTTP